MRSSELRKEYLIEQAITYVTVGLFLIAYANDAQAKGFILAVGIALCVFSLANIVVATFVPQFIHKMVLFSRRTSAILLPLASMALFVGVAETRDKGFLELRFWISFVFICVATLSMAVGVFKGKGIFARISLGKDKKGTAYKTFYFIGVVTALLGVLLVFIGVYDPNTGRALANLNKWLYDPILWFAIAILCVFPILILTPDDRDDD